MLHIALRQKGFYIKGAQAISAGFGGDQIPETITDKLKAAGTRADPPDNSHTELFDVLGVETSSCDRRCDGADRRQKPPLGPIPTEPRAEPQCFLPGVGAKRPGRHTHKPQRRREAPP